MDPLKKLSVYQKKLLDTGKRNKLINYKFSLSSNISFLSDSFYDIYDAFTSQDKFLIAELFKLSSEFDEDVNDKVCEDINGKLHPRADLYTQDDIKDIINGNYKKNTLYPLTITNVCKRTLRNLKRKSTIFFEESGINVLYLAFGFLNWKDPIDDTDLLSPLCLLPVTIINKTINDNFYIKALDDNFLINDTLLYKLKMEAKINLDDIKADNIKDYLEVVNKLITKYDYSIVNKIELGLFSFAKIKMYNDIEMHKEMYAKNKIVATLCNQNVNLNTMTLKDIDKIDENALDSMTVVSSDSSQNKAVLAAKNGMSFVLQGPPGCGKSQTITNMIASLICQNKKVLFVCEKKAALNVVYKNLEKVGLTDFCLALHDPNVAKKQVVESIAKKFLEVQDKRIELSKKALEVFDELDIEKNFLDSYVKELNSNIFEIEMTPFEIASEYIKIKDYDFNYPIDVTKLTKKEYLSNLNLLKDYSSMVSKLGYSLENHLFYGLKLDQVSIKQMADIKNILSDLLNIVNECISFSIDKEEIINFSNLNDFLFFYEFYSNLDKYSKIPLKYFEYKNFKESLDQLKILEEKYKIYKDVKDKLDNKYDTYIRKVDAIKYKKIIKDNSSFFKRLFNKEYKQTINQINSSMKTPKKQKFMEYLKDLDEFINFNEIQQDVLLNEVVFNTDYKEIYSKNNPDFKLIKNTLDALCLYEELYKNRPLSFIDDINLYNNDIEYKKSCNKAILSMGKYKDEIEKNIQVINNYYDKECVDFASLDLKELKFKLMMSLKNLSSANEYANILVKQKQINAIYPDLLKELALVGSSCEYQDIFNKNLYSLLLDKFYSTSDIFFGLDSERMNRTKEEYKKNLLKTISLAKTKITDSITESWVQLDGILKDNTEVTTLLSEMNKKKKLKPLATLFSEIPNLLTDLKPCFMMSPLSVSMFLDPTKFEFDCVIFDEASQLTSENAIASIARSKAVVVVGDNEQLPPTSFFQGDVTDEDDYEYDVYESILDECKTTLPTIMLKWHYRSKDESLIQFSNEEIYHGLNTFKEAYKTREGMGVCLSYVEDGIYERGKRYNMKEALRVVDLVFRQFDEYPERSLGVVTLNISQQLLIENLIAKRRHNDTRYEKFFDESISEPFFVKNLETVQGDERDVIILSIGFGKDNTNKLSMNFGPLNQDGGYKRLNVAITRAKEEVILVSSILGTDFNLSKVDAKGVIMLKRYIEFAQNNKNKETYRSDNENGIALDIQAELAHLGYEADINIGSSAFKIDVALKSNLCKDDYSVAVIIDGLSYSNSNNTKDRDYLYQEILQNRGWKLYYVWSFEYIKNKQKIIDEIIKLSQSAKEINQNNVIDVIDDSYIAYKEIETVHVGDLFEIYPTEEMYVSFVKNEYSSLYDQVYNLILKLSPINIEHLKKIMLPLYNKTKLTQATSNLMQTNIDQFVREKKFYQVVGYLLKQDDLFDCKFRRADTSNKDTRPIEFIFVEELAAGMKGILNYTKEMYQQTLFDTLDELLGYTRRSEKITEVYTRTLNDLVLQNVVVIENDNVKYLG